jgi:type III secretion system YscQ/HrcQ family protein
VARRLRLARRQLSDAVALERISHELAELVAARVELSFRPLGRAPVREHFLEIVLDLGARTLGIGVSPDLATALLGRILGRAITLERPDATLDASLRGALAALAVEAARRVAREPVALSPGPLAEPGAAVDLTVRVDGKPHAAYVLLGGSGPSGIEAPATLAELGDIEVALPLVVAVSLATRAELARLRPGSAWLPGSGALVDARGFGRGVLAAPNGDGGAPADLTADGQVVLREGRVALTPDEASARHGEMAEANGDDTLTDAVLEAPVVVRVELGTVSMPASDWAKLRPGDVIETGTRVAEPVVLRIAGRAVARGELVDVDGELGVRIRELVKA